MALTLAGMPLLSEHAAAGTSTTDGWTTSAWVAATSATPGTPIVITVRVESARSRWANIKMQISDPNGGVMQRRWPSEPFTAGVTRTFTAEWTIPAGEELGTHVVKVGVLNRDSELLAWNRDAATFAVVAPSGTTDPTTTGPLTTGPGTTPPPPRHGGCEFATATQPVQVAFCETFDEATPSPGTRSGDLDATLWGVSRTNTITNWTQGELNRWSPATLRGCGAPQTVLPPNDVRVCGGRLHEAVQDSGGQSTLAIYPKQPFDIAGRTGTVVFDVSADSDGPHAAWPEFWWTDQPVPSPRGPLSASEPYARNSVGFSIASACSATQTGVDQIMVTRAHRLEHVDFVPGACITKGTVGGPLNHFEVKLSSSRIEIWGTDAGASTLKLMAAAAVAMPLTRGVIWVEDVHYNACKEGFGSVQCDHTFAWDNIGFDGPQPYRDLTFDVVDAGVASADGVDLGYRVDGGSTALTAPGVYWLHDPAQAYVGFNWFAWETTVPKVRVNGGPWHETAWPFDATAFVWRTIAVPIAMSEVRAGANTIEFSMGGDGAVVANVNLILIDAAPVD